MKRVTFQNIRNKTLIGNLYAVEGTSIVVHGNHPDDTEELQLLENSKRGMQYLSPDSQLEVIEGATHSFMEHLPIIQEKAIAWYKTYL